MKAHGRSRGGSLRLSVLPLAYAIVAITRRRTRGRDGRVALYDGRLAARPPGGLFVDDGHVEKRALARPSDEAPATPVKPDEAPSVSWLPMLALTSAYGLAAVVAADALSRSGRSGGEPLFWAGVLVILLPVAWRLLSEAATRTERLALVALAGVALYLVKVARDPFEFTLSDELIHAHNANEIVRTHSLLGENPLLSVTPDYPGLETTTAALSSLSGLGTFAAGLVIVGTARLVIMLALFLLLEQVSGSARVAGVAALLYTAAPNFLFWSAQFSYESLALPLLVVVLYGVTRWMGGIEGAARLGWAGAILLVTTAVVMTHHMTSYALVAALLAASLLHLRVAPRRSRSSPWPFAVFAVGVTAAWLVFVASETAGYLTPVFTNAVESTVETVRQETPTRTLFTSDVGVQAPFWERATALASVGLVALALPFGLFAVWKRHRSNAMALVLALGGSAYVATILFRLVPEAWEVAIRASDFLFLGAAFVVASTGIEQWAPRRARWAGRAAAVIGIGIIFAGGVIAGWTRDLRLAQTYSVAVGPHTIEPQGRAAARWSREHLGPGRRFAADQSNGRLLLAHGGQFVRVGGRPAVNAVIRLPTMERWEIDLLADERLRYVLVDRRLISEDALAGYFFTTATSPAERRWLYLRVSYAKFDRQRETSRIFDSGNVVVYDVGRLLDDARRN